jgi:aspartate kinase
VFFAFAACKRVCAEEVYFSTQALASWKARCCFAQPGGVCVQAGGAGCVSVAVIKLGGSILAGVVSYRRAANFIVQRLAGNSDENLVVVVSAQHGETDALLREARAIAVEPGAAALDLLWSTGELRSVARLALYLQAAGIRAAALDVRQTGLRIAARGLGVARAEFGPASIRKALTAHRVVIVPGFLATDDSGAIVTLGRGGSDLTAVVLAVGMGASRCELIKDVPGYFTDDPKVNADAQHLPRLSYAQALAMADEGCDLVQGAALEAAERCDLPIVVRSLEESGTESWITAKNDCEKEGLAPRPIEHVGEADLSSIINGSREN